MAENQTTVPGSSQPDPQAIHPRTLSGLPSGSQQVCDNSNRSESQGAIQPLSNAIFGSERPQQTTDEQLKITDELSSLAERVSQLTDSEEERNAIVRRLCGCIQPAVKLLDGNQEAAMRWMKTSNTALRGEVPLEMALRSDDDAHEVEQLIGRIQYAVFA